MDFVKAKALETQLAGKTVGGCVVEALIGHGKSAAVFAASKATQRIALKIFDDELIERYGDEVQLKRIERELWLVDKSHPNMVKILEGGVDPISNNHYMAMEFLDGPNLKACLARVAVENIPSLIQQLASAAQFLENHNLVHRDIKPENIVLVENYSKLILLDFGVLRPIGEAGLTDLPTLRSFVGTLQYSSPEFLLRKEDDSLEGWRALTIYQIGGVLHDLIMRRPLFADFTDPYAVLVNAVQHERPVIQNSAVPQYLCDLAGACLLKDPKVRTRLIDWSKFELPKANKGSGQSAKQRVTNRAVILHAKQSEETKASVESIAKAERQFLDVTIDFLKEAVRSIRNDNSVLGMLVV